MFQHRVWKLGRGGQAQVDNQLDVARLRELQGVRHQVVHDLEELHFVDHDLRIAAGRQIEARSKLDAFGRRRSGVQIDGDAADVRDIDCRRIVDGCTLRELGVVEEAV